MNIQCETTRAGTLHCAVGKSGIAEIRKRARPWLELGAPIHILDEFETQSKTGANTFAISLLDFRFGTFQPFSYVRGVAKRRSHVGPTSSHTVRSGASRTRTAHGPYEPTAAKCAPRPSSFQRMSRHHKILPASPSRDGRQPHRPNRLQRPRHRTGTLFGRELARYLFGGLRADDVFLPFSTLQNIPMRAFKEGYYRLGAGIAHLPPSN